VDDEQPGDQEPMPAGSLANPGDAAAARAAARGDAIRRLGLRDPLPLTIIRAYKVGQQRDANGAAGTRSAHDALVMTTRATAGAQETATIG
jgi:hypothetical protein